MAAGATVSGMIAAHITVTKTAYRVADVRDWLKEVDALGIDDSTVLTEDTFLQATLNPTYLDYIDCGEHIPTGPDYSLPRDLLFGLHNCEPVTHHSYVEGKPE